MAKYKDINMSGEEFYLRKATAENSALFADKASEQAKKPTPTKRSVGFEASLNGFSSKNVPKRKRKKKRRFDKNCLVRLVAVCVCVGIFAFSVYRIGERLLDLSHAKTVNESLGFSESNSIVSHPKQVRKVSFSKDLLSFLGSNSHGMEMLDTDTQNRYEDLREIVISTQKENPDCIGYITVSDTNISYRLMKTTNNDYYLKHLWNGDYSSAGSIFADCRLNNDYDKNMNTVVYGHCMTNGSMFRGIKVFFDSEYRYSRAQDMEITVVTADGVYIYEYFSGYRSEGSYFASCYTDNGKNTGYYSFLKTVRALNTIPKDVGYNANSKIITLITCTNLASKPDERYVLHGILSNYFSFE